MNNTTLGDSTRRRLGGTGNAGGGGSGGGTRNYYGGFAGGMGATFGTAPRFSGAAPVDGASAAGSLAHPLSALGAGSPAPRPKARSLPSYLLTYF